MTVQEFIASGIAKSTEDLINAYNRTAPEKRGWEPEGARSSRNVLAECAVMTDGLADVVSQGKMPDIDFEVFFGQVSELDTDEKAITALRVGTEKLVAATKAIPDDKLAVDIVSPWGTYTTAAWAAHAMTHNSYHEGQINYIQTLYGDKGAQVPE